MPSELDIFLEYANLENGRFDWIGEPVTEAEIDAFEARYNVKLPTDIREYFLKINGVGIYFIAIDPLSEWTPVLQFGYASETYFREMLDEAEHYFMFGHYDIDVWYWVVRLNRDRNAPTPIFVIHEKTTKLADSFSEFLQKFRTQEPEGLLGYD